MIYLGNRKIRSAGRSSGSIEITLPAQLQELEGVECRLIVRDGPHPEIVLQPNLTAIHRLFQDIWRKLALGMSGIDEIGDFALGDFTLTLLPTRHWAERPVLAYSDGFALLGQRAKRGDRVPEALPRLWTALAAVAGQRLGLRAPLDQAFGDAVAHLLTGDTARPGNEFECGMAYQVFHSANGAPTPGLTLNEGTLQQAQAGLRRVFDQFQLWQDQPLAYSTARERWYRALSIEMSSH